MQILDLVLSFALLMIGFSTIASGMTELLLRLLNSRTGNLANAVRSLAEDVLVPNAIKLLGDRAGLSEEEREKLVTELCTDLTRNPVYGRSARILPGWLKLPSTQMVDALSSEAFVQRLAKTSLGKLIADQDGAGRATVLNDMTLAFERYMATSAELFRKYANVAALLVAIVFAGAANIQLGPLVSYLRDNPAVVAQVIDQNDRFITMAENQTLSDSTLEAAVKEVSEQIDQLQSDFQLPIGWSVSGQNNPTVTLRGVLEWCINVLAAGLLIGLGAPFWYRVVQRISQFRLVAGAVAGQSDETVGSPKAASAAADPMARLKAHVDLFEASAQIEPGQTGKSVSAPT